MEYRLAQKFFAYQLESTFNTFEAFGADGYVYMTSIFTTSKDGRTTSSGLFLNIDHSKSPYQYSFGVSRPNPTPASLLRQLNEQGARGYRPKTYLSNDTTSFIVNVRDASRPMAKYMYRLGRCASNLTELVAQMNKYGAQGYRLFDLTTVEGFCTTYIKDTSKKSQFVYEMVPKFDNTDDLLAKSNELGARGYRHPNIAGVIVKQNGSRLFQELPLYYRDKTQKDCTFSYTSAPLPTSPDELLTLLQKQEANGFIYARRFRASTGSVLTFVKIRNCQYKSMNVDGLY